VLPACSDDAVTASNGVTLTSDERNLLERFAEVFLPTDGTSLKPRSAVPVVDNIEHAFTLMDAPTLEHVRIGLNFACHPSLAVFGEHENDIYAWVGATLSAQAGDIEPPLKGSYLLEPGMVGPVITSAWIDGGVGSDFVEFMENSKKFQAAVTLIHGHNVGRVYLDGDRKRIEYDLDDRDFESMREALRGTARIYFAAGARRVYLPTTRKTTIESADQVDSVINSLQNGKHLYRISSYHPQGTMRMGADPKKSVVGPNGLCHDLDKIDVPDASLFPPSLLVSSQITVYTMASDISDQILARA
jgi:choline dehydrogenase-like flavoprotein